ncbi:MAG: hypothetical protein RLZZ326_4142 [Planctomycetota bacterium]|jgi:hypothetical protein
MMRFKNSFVAAVAVALAAVVVSSAQAGTITDVFRFSFDNMSVGALTGPASSVAPGVSATWTTPNYGVENFGSPYGNAGVVRFFSATTYQSIAFTTPEALYIDSLSFFFSGNGTPGYPTYPSYDVSVVFDNSSLGSFTKNQANNSSVRSLSGPGWVAAGNHEIKWIVPAFTGSTNSNTDYMMLNDVVLTAAVPEIDPATGGSALSLVAGMLAMIEQRRRRAMLVA